MFEPCLFTICCLKAEANVTMRIWTTSKFIPILTCKYYCIRSPNRGGFCSVDTDRYPCGLTAGRIGLCFKRVCMRSWKCTHTFINLILPLKFSLSQRETISEGQLSADFSEIPISRWHYIFNKMLILWSCLNCRRSVIMSKSSREPQLKYETLFPSLNL